MRQFDGRQQVIQFPGVERRVGLARAGQAESGVRRGPEHVQDALGEGGVLLYETFMAGNERYGRPSNPAFLLRPGELLEAFKALRVLGFEEGPVERPRPAVTQRICAARVAKR